MVQNKKILITGGSGLLGSTLAIVLEKAGYECMLFDGDITDEPLKSEKSLVKIDEMQGAGKLARKHTERTMTTQAGTRNEADRDFHQAPEKYQGASWLVHTAAMTSVDACEKDRTACWKANVEGTTNMRRLAEVLGARLMYISTVSVFSGDEGNYREDDIVYPRNFYNFSKYMGEREALGSERGIVLRINLIGIHPSGSRGKNFLEFLFDSAKENRDMTLFTDIRINALSNWTIAEYIEKIISKNSSEKMLHLGAKDTLSKADIGTLVLAHFPDYTGKVAYGGSSERGAGAAYLPKEMWLNTDRARRFLGPMPALASEVERALQGVI